MQDIYGMGLVKPFVFGFIIVTVACHVGWRRIDEVTRVRRDNLHVDTGTVHLGQSRFEIGQIREVGLAALLLDGFCEVVDVGVGIRRLPAARDGVKIMRRYDKQVAAGF